MADLTAYQPIDMSNVLGFSTGGVLTSYSSIHITVSDGVFSQTYFGNFIFGSSGLTGGTVTGANSSSVGGQTYWTLSNVNIDIWTIYNFEINNDANGYMLYVLRGNDDITGSDYADFIQGFLGDDTIKGGGGNDSLRGDAGNDYLDGGFGVDYAFFLGNLASYSITATSVNSGTVSGPDGIDTLVSLEYLVFSDQTVAMSSLFDATPPTAIIYSPADGAINVPLASNIVITFSEAIQRGTGNIVLMTADGTMVETFDAATSSHVSIAGSTLTIDPASDLIRGINYYVTFTSGTIKDLAGNAYAGTASYDFTTIMPGYIMGTDGDDNLSGTSANNTIDGGLGCDTVYFTGNRGGYILTNTFGGYQVQDNTIGRDGIDILNNVETLHFADCTVDLLMGQKVASISAADLKVLEELYVGFFNRIPEAGGLFFWVDGIKNGTSLKSVADQFYDAGVEYGVYSATMSDADFIKTVYANVLGRSGVTAPDSGEISYWQGRLDAGTSSKGDMVLEMINVSHSQYTNDPNVGWVVDLLNHKAEVANYFAVQQGLSYLDAQTSIAKGIQIAAVITPTDTSAAIALIGVNDFAMATDLVGY